MSEESTFVKRRLLFSGPKNIKDVALVALKKTPIGKAAKVVGSVLGVGAAAKGVSDLKDDESFEEGREEGKKEGSDFKARAKKEIGKKLGQVEGVINKRKGGKVKKLVYGGVANPTIDQTQAYSSFAPQAPQVPVMDAGMSDPMGGYKKGGSVNIGKGKDYIKDLL